MGYGFYVNVEDWGDAKGVFIFFGSIAIIIIFHYKLLREMARDEKL